MNGVIIVNKPKGMTSHDVVCELRKKTKFKSIGHAGTLDPLATGVLPILVGRGTRISKYLMDHDKEYIATVKLGIKTVTGDITGEVIETQEVDSKVLDIENLKDVLESFIGKQEQVPPMYSAIKVNGKKLYEYARQGQEVERKSRSIEIYNMEFINFDEENKEIKFKVSCSKGTYIRTICEELAKELGTIGTMTELVRTKSGSCRIENSIELSKLETLSNSEIEEKHLMSIEETFKDSKSIHFKTDIELKKFIDGLMTIKKLPNGVYRMYDKDNKFIGLGTITNNLLKRDVVL